MDEKWRTIIRTVSGAYRDNEQPSEGHTRGGTELRREGIPKPDAPPPRQHDRPYSSTWYQSNVYGQRPSDAYPFNAGNPFGQQLPNQASQPYYPTTSLGGPCPSHAYTQPAYQPQNPHSPQYVHVVAQSTSPSYAQPSNPSQNPQHPTTQIQADHYSNQRPQYHSVQSDPAVTGPYNPLGQDPRTRSATNPSLGGQASSEYCRHNILKIYRCEYCENEKYNRGSDPNSSWHRHGSN